MLDLLVLLAISTASPQIPLLQNNGVVQGESRVQLASKTFSMEKRYGNEFVNGVFADNILLALHYMNGNVASKEDINWDEIQSPNRFEFTLNPGEGFAFHDVIAKEFEDKIVKTTNSHFNASDGYKFSGALYGDGVCHLASFIHMVALEAGLESTSPVKHDFAEIPEVSREYGVSIKYMPGEYSNSSRQNLYIVNNQEKAVTFVFDYDGTNLTVSVEK